MKCLSFISFSYLIFFLNHRNNLKDNGNNNPDNRCIEVTLDHHNNCNTYYITMLLSLLLLLLPPPIQV